MGGARVDGGNGVDGITGPTVSASGRSRRPVSIWACLVSVSPAASTASADLFTLDFDVSGISSIGGSDYPGSPGSNNAIFLMDAASQLGLPSGTPLALTGVGWDVTMTAFEPARLGDMRVWITHPDYVGSPPSSPPGGWFFIAPASGFNSNSGTESFQADIADLEGPPVEFHDGLVYLEFWDWFDQLPGEPDGLWESGVISMRFTAVPAPAAVALLGLAGISTPRRQR